MNEKKENAFLKLWHNTNGKIGLLLLLSITLLALLAPVLTEYDPLAMGSDPGWRHRLPSTGWGRMNMAGIHFPGYCMGLVLPSV